MTDNQHPHRDAETMPGWQESLDEQNQRRVREMIEMGSELPADLADSLRREFVAEPTVASAVAATIIPCDGGVRGRNTG